MWKPCLALAAATLLLMPVPAAACATCACGDPTLTSMGTEQPFAGRLRLATTMRAWGLTSGATQDTAVSLRELRMDVSAAYVPLPWLTLAVAMPLQTRTVREVSLAQEQGWGFGDLEVSARATLFRDRGFAANHLLSVLAGAELPTARTLKDGQGRPLSLDAQLGSGSVDPFAGLAYTGFQDEWSFLASVTGYLPTRGREDFRGGASLRTTLAAQYQPQARWALRLAADTRLEGTSDTLGVPEPEGSGFIGFLSPDVLFSPTQDMVLQAGVRVPVLNLLSGYVRQAPIFQAALVYDL
ncbi:transporter [Stigmatella sp. ncwal1]|uniref:Transporter n=1 Tax=Stigmatella ashevillensis TaxID=2995309 RepID=A0ABT5DAJ7_9BACT|nr:transporter [Stigmatella ashevillena]MDC0710692.1 transporter [Stigmatella ashevillena]